MCYEYIDSRKTLKELSLQLEEKFSSNLNNKRMFDQSYNHAKRVCNSFKMKQVEHDMFLFNI